MMPPARRDTWLLILSFGLAAIAFGALALLAAACKWLVIT